MYAALKEGGIHSLHRNWRGHMMLNIVQYLLGKEMEVYPNPWDGPWEGTLIL